jgi:hypothetical protein
MHIVYKRCCGLDIHKDSITACLLLIDDDGEYRVEKRQFGTMTRDLRDLGTWLHQQGVERIAMEATGIYWRPVWNVLEPLDIDMLWSIRTISKTCRGVKRTRLTVSGSQTCCSTDFCAAVLFRRRKSVNFAT